MNCFTLYSMPEELQTPESGATEPTTTQPATTTEIRNPDAVLKALEAERQQRKELERQLKSFQGIDPVKYQEYTAAEQKRAEEKAEAEKRKLEERGNYEALTAKQREEHQREMKALADQLEAIKAEKEAVASQAKEKDTAIARMKLEGKALKAYLSEGGEEMDWGEFIWDRVNKHIIQTEDGGVQIIKDNGDLWTDAKGKPLDMRGFFAQFREGRGAKFFKPTVTAEGSGMQPSGKGSATTGKVIRRSELSNPAALRKANIKLEDIASGSVQIIDG